MKFKNTFVLEEDILNKLREKAREEGRLQSWFVERALLFYFQKNGEENV